jgi:hypothetical protein
MLRDIVSCSTKVEDLDQFDDTSMDRDVLGRPESSSAEAEGVLAIIDSRKFLRECIQLSMQAALTVRVETYSSVLEFGNKLSSSSIRLIMVSLSDASKQAATDTLKALSDLAPSVPIIVLSSNNDLELARVVYPRHHGAWNRNRGGTLRFSGRSLCAGGLLTYTSIAAAAPASPWRRDFSRTYRGPGNSTGHVK